MRHESQSRNLPFPADLGHERVVLERALVRFAVEKEMIPLASVAPFLEVEILEASMELPPDDGIFPEEASLHSALVILLEQRFSPLDAGSPSAIVPEALATDPGSAHGVIANHDQYSELVPLYRRVRATMEREGVEGFEELDRLIANRMRDDPGPN